MARYRKVSPKPSTPSQQVTARLIEALQKSGEYDSFNDGDAARVEIAPPPTPDPRRLSVVQQKQLRACIAEIVARENEALNLYEPMPEQDRFHRSYSPERIVRGGNRGGKTLAACVEVARIVTNQDPHAKMPTSGRFIIVGKDLSHCSKVLYRKLFKPGAFKIIRDPETKRMRAFRPWQEYDKSHKHCARPAPPLIPERFYGTKDISWENRREEIPKTVRIKTGWDMTFFSSLSSPPQGWDADGALFDEEIEHPSWYPETSARLMDHVTWDEQGRAIGGKFIWSATPQAGTQKLYELSERAAELAEEPNPPIQEFFVNILGNEHIPEEAKQQFIAKLSGDDEEYRVRVLGDFSVKGMRVFPEWNPRKIQGIPHFHIPETWTRYSYTDPGRQVCGTLFAAVPPPDSPYHGSYIVFTELYIKKCSAEDFGQAMEDKTKGWVYEAFMIDHRAGRTTEIGSGKTVEWQYSEALKRHDVKSEKTGHGFIWGNDDIKAGIEALRKDIQVINGCTRLLLFEEKCPNFCKEMKDYSYKRIGKDRLVTDDPLQVANHLVDCARYLASHSPKYVKPRYSSKLTSWAGKYIADKKKRQAKDTGWGSSVRLG